MGNEFVGYYRKSNGRAGISRQRTVTTAHIEKLGGAIVAEFPDADRTAFQHPGRARPERQGFDAMLAYLRAHPGTGIAAWHCDRLTRNEHDRAVLADLCARGAHLIETARGGSYDLSTASGRKRFRDDASDAAYEVDHNTERILEAKDEAAAEGKWLGGHVPYGSRARDGELTIWEPEAEVIRWAIGQVTAGASFRWAAADLNRRQVPAPRAARWHASNLRALLLHPGNGGLMQHRGEVKGKSSWGRWMDDSETTWGYIVPEGQWRAFRALVTAPERTSASNWERRYLGSGLYRCGAPGCGQPLRRHQTNGTPMYRCPAGTREARHVTRDAESLDEYVRHLCCAWVADHAEALDAGMPADESVTLALAEVSRYRDLLNEQALLHARNIIDGEQLAAGTAELRAGMAAAQERARALAAFRPLAPFAAISGDAREAMAGQIWDSLTVPQRQAVIRDVMTVTVLPLPRGPNGGSKGAPRFRPEYIEIVPVRGKEKGPAR